MNPAASALRNLYANIGLLVRRVVARSALPNAGGVWLCVALRSDLAELPTHGLPFQKDPPLALVDVLRALEAAVEDPRIAGVCVRFHGGGVGWAASFALYRALRQVRDAGKRVVAWGAALDIDQYLIACAAEQVLLPVSGGLGLVGLRSEQLFVRGLLEQLEVKPELVAIGTHKTAGEIVLRDSMSDEQREQISAWQQDLFERLVEIFARERGSSEAEVRERIDCGPYTADLALRGGLIDGVCYPDEIDARLMDLVPPPKSGSKSKRSSVDGETAVPLSVDVSRYLALHAGAPEARPWIETFPEVAYVVAEGGIQRGASARGIADEPMTELFDELAKRESVRAVVLRIVSPGGDAVASDLIHRSIERLRQVKPVVVSMGDVAASGGYYMAAGADVVLAEAMTLTGSIGVVGGKVNVEGLYRKLGITKDAVESGARAGLFSETRGFTKDEITAVRSQMESIYALFRTRVAEGRGLSQESVAKVAEGRVWSGRRASALGLVDALGGPLEAIAEARRRAGLSPRQGFALRVLPRPPRLPSPAALVGLSIPRALVSGAAARRPTSSRPPWRL